MHMQQISCPVQLILILFNWVRIVCCSRAYLPMHHKKRFQLVCAFSVPPTSFGRRSVDAFIQLANAQLSPVKTQRGHPLYAKLLLWLDKSCRQFTFNLFKQPGADAYPNTMEVWKHRRNEQLKCQKYHKPDSLSA
jgi:hypothetical protein